MVERTLDDLRRDLEKRRRHDEPRPVVLLGAGASAGAGLATMKALYEAFGVEGFEAFVGRVEQLNENERFRELTEFLQTQDPLEVTPGYRALATLCAHHYFDLVLTTNFDPLLDDALATARLRRRDYLLLVNGILRPERLRWLLPSPSPRVKVIKLHGDLFHRFMAWTPAEMETYLAEITPSLSHFLYARDFLVVGHSLRDEKIREMVEKADGAVWFVNPREVPEEIRGLRDLRAVVGEEMVFEHVFTTLADGLVPSATAQPAAGPELGALRGRTKTTRSVTARETVPAAVAEDGADTLDDLVAASFGIAPAEDAPPLMTGFLVADPRVIVTDGYAGNTAAFDPERITLVTSLGRRLTTRVSRLLPQHPFGPWVLEAPSELKVHGLRVSGEPLAPDERLQIAVVAGERTGLASGRVLSGREERVPIQGLGEVPDLVHLEAVVAPGSSGAPAVDADLAVRGFVVAGSSDERRPHTFLYSARQWLAQLRGGG